MAAHDGLARFGHPEIFDTDQGSQLTSALGGYTPDEAYGIDVMQRLAA